MIAGSCLCKAVEFAVSGELHYGRYCHCKSCRKFSGTSGAAWSTALTEEFSITRADAEITKYQTSNGSRCFCARCGSPVFFESSDHPGIIGIPLGAIDSGAVARPEMRVWLRSAMDWEEINDDLPKHDTHP